MKGATLTKHGYMRAFRWGWTALMLLLSSVPYLIFWYKTPPNHRYLWILPPYPEDSLGYIAWSQQAAHGDILFRLKYTALPHAAFFFNPFFLICGWLSRLSGCDVQMVHWAVKGIGVVLFFGAFYKYVDYLGLTQFQSGVASIFVGISSGFGGLLAFAGLVNRWQLAPADLWMPEVSTNWALLWNPLFPFSLSLIVLIIYWLDRGTRCACKVDVLKSGITTGVLALIHPYALPFLFTYAVIVTLVRQGSEALVYLSRFFAASSPFVLYIALLSVFEPLVARHSARGEMRSPQILDYVLGFGFPFILLLAGLAMKAVRLVKPYGQLLLWFFLSLGLAYLPLWFQRKLVFGSQIPLCILAAVSLDLFFSKIAWFRTHKWAMWASTVLLLPLLASTPTFLLMSEAAEVERNTNSSYFIPNELQDGLRYLRSETRPDEVVFATYETSRLIPGLAGNTVVWGHWAMSVDLEERKQWNAQLFNENQNWQDKSRSAAFWGSGIQYIFADGRLKDSIEHNPEMWKVILDDADPVFANSSVLIFRHSTSRPNN